VGNIKVGNITIYTSKSSSEVVIIITTSLIRIKHHNYITAKKGFVILTIVFLTRIATVDMVLWDDTRMVPCDSQL